MTNSRLVPGLQTIFAVFLGLMITAFLGVGVNTFYPSPARRFEQEMEALGRQERRIEQGRPSADLSPAERDQMRTIRDSTAVLNRKARESREQWGRNTSIVLVLLATFVMAVAVVRAEQLAALSNGLLLGGVFTMCYGVGMILVTTTSVARFVMLTAALGVTIGLGYFRFVRQVSGLVSASPGAAALSPHDNAALAARIDRLERRLDAAGQALAGSGPSTRDP